MEVIKLGRDNLDECVSKAAQVLRAGGVIVYPTDTIYGLGADAFSDEAFERVCMIKDRDQRRPIHAVFADLAQVEEYAEVSTLGHTLAREFMPGPLTLVFQKKVGIDTGIARSLHTVGVRIPKHQFCLALARAFGPYTTTSANRSGEETPATVGEIVRQLGHSARYVDLAIDAGALPPYAHSTVVDARDGTPFILREGSVSAPEIWNAIRSER